MENKMTYEEWVKQNKRDTDRGYKCPFLNNGRCSIYEERFLICAMYSVVGTNAQCSKANTGEVAVVNPIGVISMAASSSKDVEARMKRHILLDTEGSDVLKEFASRFSL